MSKNLIIVQSINDFHKFKGCLSKGFDILPLSQSIISVLHKKGIKYKSIEDFYSIDQYFKDTQEYNKRVDSLLVKLDKVCKDSVNFPYAYSGNEHYMLMWLDDLLYLDKFIQTISRQYKKIYLYAAVEPNKISSRPLSYSELNSYRVNGTISFPLEKLIQKRVQLIYSLIEVFFLQDGPPKIAKIPIHLKIKKFSNRLFKFVKKKALINRRTFDATLKEMPIYVIQDSYEVSYLKKYLPKFNYLYPVKKLRTETGLSSPQNFTGKEIDEILINFAQDNFSFLSEHVYLVIYSYHKEIVGRINFFKKNFERLIKNNSPKALLFSTGIRDVMDAISCHVANQHNIPVVFFQHGTHCLFGYNPYQKSLENNPNLSKTLIVNSKLELDELKNHASNIIPMGSIQQYEKNHEKPIVKKSKDIVFCLGPDVGLTFRSMLNYYSMSKRHTGSLEVMATVNELLVSTDIKLHPTGEDEDYECYTQIVKDSKYNDISVIYGSFGESVLGRYKLIIIDFLETALIKHVLSLKVPVIIYDCDFNKIKIKETYLSDLRKRCYIVGNKKELKEVLLRYKNNELPSKWHEGFVDNYIYPIDGNSPGIKIAKYINSVVKEDFK
jgi:hypothetical protein